ncbi:Hypothetical predicted protein [Mytilus galloprovincialis]|uniref:Uncharacterized protein n=1 Tax=Mytilus galloprovincialis TaxID=29158 RepID=A0A8B6DV33_MYTGA|nr:Hypothetical predicted protein [Mytilus galloprovincialis]
MLLLIDIFNYTLCKIGECHRYGSNDWFCCNNYEMRENICVECRPGYTSFSRKSCVPCPKNSYGRRCAEICSCTELERCDYIKGCVNDSSEDIVTTETYIEECRLGYTSAINKPCVPCSDNSYGKRCTERCACTEVERCDHIMGCVYASSAVNTTNKNDIEVTPYATVVYVTITEECRLGYASLHKHSCLPCPNNTYGKRCAETCACTAHERCDHVQGCTNTSAALNNTTDIFVEDTAIKPSLKTTENRDHNDSSLKPISIYSISVASLTFMLIVGILLIVNCRRYTGTRSQKSDTKEKHLQQT